MQLALGRAGELPRGRMDALREEALFAELTPAQWESVLAEARWGFARSNRVLCAQGGFATAFCVIVEGQVGVYRECAERGRERLGALGVGGWMGEESLMGHCRLPYSLVTERSSCFLVLEGSLFCALTRSTRTGLGRFLRSSGRVRSA